MLYVAVLKAYKCKPCPLPEGTAWGFAWLAHPTHEPFTLPDFVVGARGLKKAYELAVLEAHRRHLYIAAGSVHLAHEWGMNASYALRGRPIGPSPEEAAANRAEAHKAWERHGEAIQAAEERWRRGERPWRLHSIEALQQRLTNHRYAEDDPEELDIRFELHWRMYDSPEDRSRRSHVDFPMGNTITTGPAPFAALGLTPTASAADVKRAFRARALTAHPDHGGTDAAFIALQRAYTDALRMAGG